MEVNTNSEELFNNIFENINFIQNEEKINIEKINLISNDLLQLKNNFNKILTFENCLKTLNSELNKY